jgi:hypothetical protein
MAPWRGKLLRPLHWMGFKLLWHKKKLFESTGGTNCREKFFASWSNLSHIAAQQDQAPPKALVGGRKNELAIALGQ